jgi:hypothetical protein
MLKVDLAPGYETARGQNAGVPLPVSWVEIPDADPVPPSQTIGGVLRSSVFQQGLDAGGAVFRRLECCWFSNGKLYFHSTTGGDMALGQIWVYDPRAETRTLLRVSLTLWKFYSKKKCVKNKENMNTSY